MPLPIIGILSAVAPIAQPLLEWAIAEGKKIGDKKRDIAEAFYNYKAELKSNCVLLKEINLDKVDPRNIAEPGLRGIVSRLKTEAANALLLALLSHLDDPQKAAKALPPNNINKADTAEARNVIKTIIAVMEKTRQLQVFTTLSEDERRILKGFYARARLKHIIENSLYLKAKFAQEKKRKK